ncbi:BON domain-containing protein [Bdellovibrio sp. BCCA]|uniref:BON domain-containing protein n=1 Tax=Bdellovibrio sp. BCCA TaxID=3136281 RepID=UPI0030F18CF7
MKRQLVTTLIFVFVGSFAHAMGDSPKPQTTTVRPTYKNYHRQPATTYHSDRDLQATARRSLDRDTGFSDEARNVNIRVRGGRASIQGFVQSPEESDALKRKVMAIDGVHRVDDKTSVRE